MIRSFQLATLAATLIVAAFAAAQPAPSPLPIAPAHLPKLGTVDPRFQSYNIEMLEVTGGRFWAPYKQQTSGPAAVADTAAAGPGGMPASLYRNRAPIDLTNPRLRMLAAALGPAYLRVSGTWANSTWFQDNDDPTPAKPPTGFGGILTRAQWRGVLDFSKAVDAPIVTSFAVSTGVRDANGRWTPVEAQKFLAFTHASGGKIAAAEFFNEPTMAALGGAPKGYDAAAYGSDFHVFQAFLHQAAPEAKILGPGGVGEGGSLAAIPGLKLIRSEDMLTDEGPGLDAFSYHFYGGVSLRCAIMGGAAAKRSLDDALSADWLARTAKEEAFYAVLRDRFTPGKPIWLTETGETACGGDPWAATFLDSFRYLNQLGSLALRGVQVVMHNTLAASDYALIDEATLTPRPNYWSALLWHRLMGTTVLDPGKSSSPDLHLYAQCLPNHPGGVALLAINADRSQPHAVTLPIASTRYTLSESDLADGGVQLNGALLALTPQGDLPALAGLPSAKGAITLAPATITFLAIPNAKNSACR